MTLHTRVAITGPYKPFHVFDAAVTAVLNAGGEPNRDVQIAEPTGSDVNNIFKLQTEPGQGLPAWTDLTYRPSGAPLYDVDTWDEDGDDRWFVSPACDMQLSMDTSYGARFANGVNCSGMHALAILELARALPEAKLVWQNEYSGTWNHGLAEGDHDKAQEEFRVFLGAGREADSWFEGTVVPFLESKFDKVVIDR